MSRRKRRKKTRKEPLDGMETLRVVLKRMRWDDQDGYLSVGPDGKYAGHASFITTGLPQVTPEELDALMELAGIVPDPIVTLGSCSDCVHATADGRERGYSRPCFDCSRPQHSNFDPITDDHQRADHPDYGNDSCGCRVCIRPTVLRRLGRKRSKKSA